MVVPVVVGTVLVVVVLVLVVVDSVVEVVLDSVVNWVVLSDCPLVVFLPPLGVGLGFGVLPFSEPHLPP